MSRTLTDTQAPPQAPFQASTAVAVSAGGETSVLPLGGTSARPNPGNPPSENTGSRERHSGVEPDSRRGSAPAEAARRPLSPRVWIAWETQRRSLNLSQKVGAELAIFDHEDKGLYRYPLSIAKTLSRFWRYRGQVVFVQNPSMILAAFAALLKPLFRYTLVVDRHSNFDFGPQRKLGFKDRVHSLLSLYSLRGADITIITNRELYQRVEREGGHAFVLPDPFPSLEVREAAPLPRFPAKDRPEILFVSSWAFDEPILETLEACRLLGSEARIFISGKPKERFKEALRGAPENFIPTGFLSDEEYFALMNRVDAVIAITKRPATLVCGAYEAISLGKPILLGDSESLREYFDRGAVYTDSSPADIAAKVRRLIADLPRLREEIRALYADRTQAWEKRLDGLNRRIEDLARR